MNRTIALTVLVLASLLLGLVTIQPVNSVSPQTIVIKPDGSISPSSAPIHEEGRIFSLIGNTNSPVFIEESNIIFDGGGHTIQGSGGLVALNLTCTNVTVQNLKIINWQAGVLGVFNNNTIKDSSVTQCDSAIKIYAQYYAILNNEIENNSEAIRIGQGGLNLIAGNNIINNGDGLTLYDSGNIVVDNNFENGSHEAIYLDVSGWSQTVYHNNFVNNLKDLVDNSGGFSKPVVSALSPWDNGSSGNYWSQYPFCDLNKDGVGDSPYQIPTYYAANENQIYSNSFVDRYPMINPFNINTANPIPTTAPTLTISASNATSSDQTLATSFLKNVIQLDLSKYTVKLGYGILRAPNNGLSTDYLGYGLANRNYYYANTANSTFTISNNTVASFSLQPIDGQLFSAYTISNNFNTAVKIMQNYQAWTNDNDVNKLVTLLNQAGSERNTTEILDNISLKISVTPMYTSFNWSYTYNGADYSSVNLQLSNYIGFPAVKFADNRALYNIGNTNIEVSKQQAINIAENFVRGYSYPVNFGNGTIATIKDLNVIETNTSADLATTSRDPTTLYPYWSVQTLLDHTYPGQTYAITVNVWADTGTVFNAQREVTPTSFPTSQLPFNPLALIPILEIFIIAAVAVLATIVAVLIYVLKKDQPKKTPSSL